MPDLTLHLAQVCAQAECFHSARVPSSSGAGEYYVTVRGAEDTCTCPGHKFHGHCRHVRALREQLCSWDSEHGVAQTLQQNVDMVCPCCGGDTQLYRFAA